MVIQGPHIGVVFNGVEAIREMTVNYRYTARRLSNERSARINGLGGTDTFTMNLLDQLTFSQRH